MSNNYSPPYRYLSVSSSVPSYMVKKRIYVQPKNVNLYQNITKIWKNAGEKKNKNNIAISRKRLKNKGICVGTNVNACRNGMYIHKNKIKELKNKTKSNYIKKLLNKNNMTNRNMLYLKREFPNIFKSYRNSTFKNLEKIIEKRVKKIQNYWRLKYLYNPYTEIGKRRLLKEFEELTQKKN